MAELWWNCTEEASHFAANSCFGSYDCCGSVGSMNFGTSLIDRYAGLLVAELVEDRRCSRLLVAT